MLVAGRSLFNSFLAMKILPDFLSKISILHEDPRATLMPHAVSSMVTTF